MLAYTSSHRCHTHCRLAITICSYTRMAGVCQTPFACVRECMSACVRAFMCEHVGGWVCACRGVVGGESVRLWWMRGYFLNIFHLVQNPAMWQKC